jgi:hypothetical protein
MSPSIRTHILFAGLLWSALLFAAPPAANAGLILAAPTYVGLNSGLAAYWTFNGSDMANAIAYDRSGNGVTGTIVTGPKPTIGKLGQALEIHSESSAVGFDEIASVTNLKSMSISAWIKLNTTCSSVMFVITKAAGASAGCIFTCPNNITKGLFFTRYMTSGAADRYMSDNSIAIGQWQHVLVTFASSTLAADIHMYVNGVETGYQSPHDGAGGILNDTGFGGGSLGDGINGALDDVRVYNRILSDDEIKRLYKIGSTLKFGAPNNTGSLSSGLVGWWTMDGGDTSTNGSAVTTILDRSGNNNKGTFSGATSPRLLPGKIGQGVSFDGADDQINAGAGASITDLTTATWSMWVKRTASGPGPMLYKGNNSSAEGWFLDVKNGADAIGFAEYENSTNGERYVLNVPAVGEWFHFAVTWAGTSAFSGMHIFINGVESTTYENEINGSGGHDPEANRTLYIGSSNGELGPEATNFPGLLDDVRIYNRILSKDEIKRLYKIGSTLKQGAPNSTGSLSNGLVGWWTMDGADSSLNTSGIRAVVDRSGNGNTGKSPTAARAPVPTIGKIGQALRFDGSNDGLDAGNNASLRITGSMTLSAWIYLNSLSDRNFLSKSISDAADDSWKIGDSLDNGPDQLRFLLSQNGSTEESFYSATTLVAKRWYHAVAVYNASAQTVDIYLNGARDNGVAGTVPSSQHDSPENVFIGEDPNNGGVWDGLLDDVRIYNRALSTDEVKRLYNMGR